MNSNRPYFIRAMYEWISDNNQVPQVIIDSTHSQVLIPPGLDKERQIILNLSMDATHNLVLGNDLISFATRFSGKSEDVSFPPDAVIGIFARDSGQGMMFEPMNSTEDLSLADEDNSSNNFKKKPALKLVEKTQK